MRIPFRRRRFDPATHMCTDFRRRAAENLWDCQTQGCGRVWFGSAAGWTEWSHTAGPAVPDEQPSADHELQGIETDSSLGRRAHCACGWVGDWEDEVGDAIAEHDAHQYDADQPTEQGAAG